MKKVFLVIGLALLLAVGAQSGLAQTTTGTSSPASTAAQTSNVTIFFVACADAAVVNLSGTMEAGYDVYYQVFSGANGTGDTLTGLRRVELNGQYAFSERLAYNSGATVASGATASLRAVIAREGNPASTIYETTVNDLQDGCASPQNTVGTSSDVGGSTTNQTEPVGNFIRSPFGGFINSNYDLTPEPAVLIGARRPPQRSDTPGLIFAECDQYLPQAAPGVLYDTDNIVIFWSWFARTEAQIEDHLAQAEYSIRLNRAPLQPVVVSSVTRPSANYWVFYTVNIGSLTPGTYGIEFKLTWKQVISDGYAKFGPGTDNEQFDSSCTFTIQRNPDNRSVTNYNLMYSLR